MIVDIHDSSNCELIWFAGFLGITFRQLLVSKDFHGNGKGQLSTGEWQEALLHYYSLASFLGCVLRLGRTKNVPWFLWAKLATDTGTAFFWLERSFPCSQKQVISSHSSCMARLTFESHVWVVLNFVEPMVPFSESHFQGQAQQRPQLRSVLVRGSGSGRWRKRCWFDTGWYGTFRNGGTKSSILIGFSTINHPFWGSAIYGNLHIGWWSIYRYIFSYDDGMPPGINELKNGQFQWKGIQTCFQCCHNVFRQYVIKCQDGATSLAPKWGSLTLGFNLFIIFHHQSFRGIVIGCHWSPDLRNILSPHELSYIYIFLCFVHGLSPWSSAGHLGTRCWHPPVTSKLAMARTVSTSPASTPVWVRWPGPKPWHGCRRSLLGNWGIGENMLEQMILCVVLIYYYYYYYYYIYNMYSFI